MPQHMMVYEPLDAFVTMSDDGYARMWVVDSLGTPVNPYAEGVIPMGAGDPLHPNQTETVKMVNTVPTNGSG